MTGPTPPGTGVIADTTPLAESKSTSPTRLSPTTLIPTSTTTAPGLIALLAFPNFVDDPGKDTRTGMHHSAFEYPGFEELNASYLRLKEAGIVPPLCLDHGMTLSYYYADPDGNFVDPERIVADHAEGMSFAEIHAKAMTGGYAPDRAPVETPETLS